MDRSLFTDNATGRLVRVGAPPADWAFIPNEMPPDWTFDPDLWPSLSDAREALGTLNGIGQTLPDPELLLRPLQSRESITSSSIEGTYVTPEQLLLFEIDPKEPVSSHEKCADWMEVFNYSRALRSGCEMIAGQPFSHHVIRGVHEVLMKGVRGRDKAPGKYREGQVQIGSNARYVPPTPAEVPRLMDNLLEYVNAADDGVDPLVKAFIAHYQFEAIHPFSDGNGRLGRALLSMMIYKWLAHSHPWLYLSPFFEKYKDEYVRDMFQVSTSGNWSQWIAFCLMATLKQSHDAITRCRRFRALRDDYFQRISQHSSRTHDLIEGLFREPVLTIPSAARKCGVTYLTAKADIEKLVACGILTQFDKRRPKAFFAFEIMAIAYADDLTDTAPPESIPDA